MASNKPQIKTHVSEQQHEAIIKAQKLSGLTPSQFRRLALKNLCEQYGVTFPDDMPKHGGNRNHYKD